MWTSAIASFVLPGFGAGLRGARLRAGVFAAAGLVVDLALLWTLWALPAQLVVRAAAAIDGALVARRPPPPGRPAEWPAWVAAGVAVAGALALVFAVRLFKTPSSSMAPTLQIGDHMLVDRASPRWRTPGRGEVIVFHMPCDPARDYAKRVVAVADDTVEIRCEVLYVNGAAVARELVAADHPYQDHDEVTDTWSARPASLYQETLDGVTYQTYGVPLGDRGVRGHDFPDGDAPPTPPTCALARDAEAPVPQRAGVVIDGPSRPDDPCAPREHYVVPEGSLFVLGDNRPSSNDSRYWGVVPIEQVIGRMIGVAFSTR